MVRTNLHPKPASIWILSVSVLYVWKSEFFFRTGVICGERVHDKEAMYDAGGASNWKYWKFKSPTHADFGYKFGRTIFSDLHKESKKRVNAFSVMN